MMNSFELFACPRGPASEGAVAFEAVLDCEAAGDGQSLARTAQVGFELENDFVDLVFQLQDEPARGSVTGELCTDNEAKNDASRIVLHFLGADRTVQPGAQFHECFRCDRKKAACGGDWPAGP
jgi:hypothetical protein